MLLFSHKSNLFHSNWIKTEPLIFQPYGSWAVYFYCLLFYMEVFRKMATISSRISSLQCLLCTVFLSYLIKSSSIVCAKMDLCTQWDDILWRASILTTFCKISVMTRIHLLPLGEMIWLDKLRSYLLKNGNHRCSNKQGLIAFYIGWHTVVNFCTMAICIPCPHSTCSKFWGGITNQPELSGLDSLSVLLHACRARVRIFVF